MIKDLWNDPATRTRLLGNSWTGETWFFLEERVLEQAPHPRRIRSKQIPSSDMPEPDIIKALHTGAGIRREGLGASLSAMKIESVKLAAAQRICPDFAAIYVILLAQSAGKIND